MSVGTIIDSQREKNNLLRLVVVKLVSVSRSAQVSVALDFRSEPPMQSGTSARISPGNSDLFTPVIPHVNGKVTLCI
jgi:hypothetical protein